MAGLARCGLVSAALVCAALAGCTGGEGASDGLPVTTAVVSDATTRDIEVTAPQGGGSWPLVVALHGLGGSGRDMGELATHLAEEGTVVFAPTYRSDLTRADGLDQATRDITCGYTFARSTAPQYGGDLTQPVTGVGWSLGATFAVLGGLSTAPPVPDEECAGDGTRPDIIVGISGCYYEFAGQHLTWFDDLSGLGNKGTPIYLIAGDQDPVCPAWQSVQFAVALREAGYRVTLVELTGADHHAPVFLDERNGRNEVATDDDAGLQTVEVILDAIAAQQPAMAQP